MTVADLGIAVHSESARQATGDLGKLTNASAQAEAAVERLGKSSSTSNADLAKIAAGVEKATGLLERLSTEAANTNAQLAKMASGGSAAFRRLGDDAERAARRVRAANNNIAGRGGISARAAQAAGFNSGQQLQDIVMMSLLGQNVGTTALQQGPQLATAFQQGGGFAAIRAGLMSLVSPTTLITVGLVAATSAAIQFSSSVLNGGKSVEEILKRHKEIIDEIAAAYPHAAEAAKAYEEEAKKLPQSVVAADTAQQIEDEKKKLDALLEDLRLRLKVTGGDFGLFGAAGSEAFAGLADQLEKGQVDAEDVQKKLGELRIDPALSENAHKFAQSLQDAANEAARLEQHVGGTNAAQSAFSGVTIGRGDEAANMTKYLAQNREALRLLQRDREIAMARLGARSPDELAKAARRAEEANRKATESPDVQKYREDTAAALAYAQAMKQITDAQDARKRSLDATLASQQLDISLIGKTAGEVAAAQFAFQQLQQVREEAARAGITSEAEFQKVFGKEIDLIEKTTAKIKEYADEAAKAKLASDLQFGLDQHGRSSMEQQVAVTLKQYGLPVDLTSADAAAIRYSLNVKKVADEWQNVRDIGEDAIDKLVDSASNGFKDIGDVFESIAKDIEKEFLKLAIANPLKNALFGENLPTASNMGGLGGIISALTGGKFRGDGQSSANDNFQTFSAPAGTVTRAPLANVGMSAYRDAIGSIESAGSGGYSALGPIHKTLGQALGRYQIMEANLPAWSKTALGRTVGRSEFLGSPALQDAIFDDRFGGYVNKYGASGAASMWFTGRPSAPGAKDVLGTTGSAYVEKFNAALDKSSAKLGGFDTGITSAIKAVSNIASNGFDLSKLTSAGGFQANTTLSAILGDGRNVGGSSSGGGGILGSLFGWIGKLFGFADGTENAPSGWAWVGEQGPELRKLRAGDVIRSNQRSMQMAANGNGGGSHVVVPDVRVYVDQDGNWQAKVESISQGPARQESAKAVGSYAYQQRQGGAHRDDHYYQRLKRRA